MRAFSLGLTLVAVLAAGPDAMAGQRPRYGGELRRVMLAPVTTLDPVQASSFEELELARAIHATLVETKADGSIEAALAQSFEIVGATPAVLRLRMREGLAFPSGKPLGAAEVKQSLKRMLASRPELGRLPGIPGPGAIRAVDAVTVEIELPVPDARPLLSLLASPMASIASEPDSKGALEGAGAFAAVEARPDGRLRLAAFQRHFRGRPYLDAILVEPVVDPREQRRALEGGGWDAIDLPAAAEVPPGTIEIAPEGEETVSLWLNARRPALVHKGIVAAIDGVDRQAMVQVILKGRGEPASHLLSPRLFPPLAGYVKERAEAARTAASRARALLLYPSHDTDLALAAERVRFELRQVLTLEPRPAPLAELRALVARGDYDAALLAAYLPARGLALALARQIGTEAPDLSAGPSDEAPLLAALVAASSGGGRLDLFHRSRRLLVREGARGVRDSGGSPRYDDAWRPR